MNAWAVLAWGVCSYLVASFLIPFLRRFALQADCVARPSQDRWGRRVVPRLGGIVISGGFLAATGWGMFYDPHLFGLFAGGLLISIVGVLDDFRTLPPNTKLIAQITTGCLVVLSGIHVALPMPILAIPITIGWLVLVMNAFNLMDNMDGLSAGIGVISGLFYCWHALQSSQWIPAIVSASLTGATLGFLQFNLPPAKIFMGDAGSQILGLGLGGLALIESWKHSARLLGMVAVPTLLLAVPIFDTLFVTVLRILNGRHPFQGGKDHTSHRLGLMGLTPRQVVFALYSLTALFGSLSILLSSRRSMAVAGIWLLCVGSLIMLGACLARVRVYSGTAIEKEAVQATWIETMLMHKRRIVEVLVDFVLVSACYVIAHALRFEANLPTNVEALLLESLPWIILTKMLCLMAFGVYRGVWRYISLPDLMNIFRAMVFGSILSAFLVLYLWRFEGYSRAVFVIDGLLLFVLICGSRVMEPLLNEWVLSLRHDQVSVLIVGAGDTGEILLQRFKLEPDSCRKVVGFLDDDVSKVGSRIHGVPVMGTRRDLGNIVHRNSIQEVYIAMRNPPQELIQKVRGYCEENGLTWKTASSALPQDRSTAPPQA